MRKEETKQPETTITSRVEPDDSACAEEETKQPGTTTTGHVEPKDSACAEEEAKQPKMSTSGDVEIEPSDLKNCTSDSVFFREFYPL